MEGGEMEGGERENKSERMRGCVKERGNKDVKE